MPDKLEDRDLEEWKMCRTEMQNFNTLLTQLRLQGAAIFLTFVGAAAVALQADYANAAVILGAGATVFISIIWGIDARISRLMVAASQRSRRIENSTTPPLALSIDMHEAWKGLSWFQQRLDEFMYAFLGLCGVLLTLMTVTAKFHIWSKVALVIGGSYVLLVLIVLALSEKRYHTENVDVTKRKR